MVKAGCEHPLKDHQSFAVQTGPRFGHQGVLIIRGNTDVVMVSEIKQGTKLHIQCEHNYVNRPGEREGQSKRNTAEGNDSKILTVFGFGRWEQCSPPLLCIF